jgi:hypothetical protein
MAATRTASRTDRRRQFCAFAGAEDSVRSTGCQPLAALENDPIALIPQAFPANLLLQC